MRKLNVVVNEREKVRYPAVSNREQAKAFRVDVLYASFLQ